MVVFPLPLGINNITLMTFTALVTTKQTAGKKNPLKNFID